MEKDSGQGLTLMGLLQVASLWHRLELQLSSLDLAIAARKALLSLGMNCPDSFPTVKCSSAVTLSASEW